MNKTLILIYVCLMSRSC